MGVYIKGIDAPTDCALMLKIFPDGRVGVPVHLNWCGTMVVNDAEAVPVPPHGDLVDVDELLKKKWSVLWNGESFYVVNADDLIEAPTIVEEENGV